MYVVILYKPFTFLKGCVLCTQVLRAVLSDPEVSNSLKPEARETALIFWRDFEKSGVNLPPEQRNKFVSLSSEILHLGRQFLNETASPRPPAVIKPYELTGLKDNTMGTRLRLQAQFTQRDLVVYPGSLQAQMILHSAPEEEPRRKVYMAANSSTPEQIEILEKLLHARGELARLVGKPSFAHMTLTDKMAKSPGASLHELLLVCYLSLVFVFRKRLAFPRGSYGPHAPLCQESPTDPQSAQARAPADTTIPHHTGVG